MPGSFKIAFGRALVKILRMGAGYGGVLSEVGVRHRDGGVGCPQCDADGFEPVFFERWVRCTTCRTVFVQRRAAQLGTFLAETFSGFTGWLGNKRER